MLFRSKPGKRKRWSPMTLTLLVGQIQKILPQSRVLWDRKVFVEVVTGSGARVCKIITHQAAALRVDVNLPRGAFTDAQVAGLGYKQEFQRPGTNGAELSFFVRDAGGASVAGAVPLRAVLASAWEWVNGQAVPA